jgi:CRP-like cAMP-binding protein
VIHADDVARSGLFEDLPAELLKEVIDDFRTYDVGPGEVLLVEGEVDRGLLVVLEGELRVTLGGVELARLGPGETAGEMTVFGTDERRCATVATLDHTRLLALDEEGIRALLDREHPFVRDLEVRVLRIIGHRLRETNVRIGKFAAGEPEYQPRAPGFFAKLATALGVSADVPQDDPPEIVDVLHTAPGFKGRDRDALAALAERFEMVMVPRGENVLQEGRRAEDAFMLATGRVGVFTNLAQAREERVALLGPGQLFGHLALADAQGRSATCRALDPCYLVRIPGSVYRTLEQEDSPAGRVFRRGLIDALAIQLRLANEHLLALRAKKAGA